MTIAMQRAPASLGAAVRAVLPLLTAMASSQLRAGRLWRGLRLCGACGCRVQRHAPGGRAARLRGPVGRDRQCAGGELARRVGGWEVISWALLRAAPVMLLLLLVLAGPSNWAASPRAWSGFICIAAFSRFLGFFA
jgi:hypothetical protein